jgi:hypothetical protein
MRNNPANRPARGARRAEGLAYAADEEGRVLPVVDLAHPAFALDPSESEIEARIEKALAATKAQARPGWSPRRAIFAFMARRSILARGIASSAGTFVSGMAIYRLKLGPGNLGSWATPMDRALADALPCWSARLRLRDASLLLAGACAAAIAERPSGPLRMINLAGGAAMDSLNALMVLRRADPRALEGRRVLVSVLDLDDAGPAFASRALAALKAEGMPLSGVDARLERIAYDWKNSGALRDAGIAAGAEGAACVASSEGGLFEYAGDADIAANLRALAEGWAEATVSRSAPAGTDAESAGPGRAPGPPAWVGTISRVDGPAAFLNGAAGSSIRLRARAELEAAVADAGYRVMRSVDCPLSTSFELAPIVDCPQPTSSSQPPSALLAKPIRRR